MQDFIPVANPNIGIEEAKEAYKAISSGWISMGKKTKNFEKLISNFTGTEYAIAMNNGTSSLDAILTALDIKEKDEIIVPSLTYISTANVVMYKKGKLVLCDSNPNTFNVEASEIEKIITKNTKLIIIVDMKGMPVDYDNIIKVSKKYKIPVIADSAESLGATYKRKQIGSQLLAHSFSFFANKNLTSAEGGMIVTNDKLLNKKLRIIRNQGQNYRYNHIILGNNYRMTDVLASIGIVQFKKLKSNLLKKNKIANFYNKELSKINKVTIPFVPSYVTNHSWYNYSITVPKKHRNNLVKFLDKNKIETRLSFPPIHIQPYYKKKFKFKANNFPKALKAYNQFIDLPIWPNMKKSMQTKVCKTIKLFFELNK